MQSEMFDNKILRRGLNLVLQKEKKPFGGKKKQQKNKKLT